MDLSRYQPSHPPGVDTEGGGLGKNVATQVSFGYALSRGIVAFTSASTVRDGKNVAKGENSLKKKRFIPIPSCYCVLRMLLRGEKKSLLPYPIPYYPLSLPLSPFA